MMGYLICLYLVNEILMGNLISLGNENILDSLLTLKQGFFK
jgi:hypothetical protein